MLPISELEVTRYRGLRDFSLRGLGRVNLLVGANNSGKTSVLEAISLAAAPLDPWAWMRVASRREPVSWSVRSFPERLRWLFPQDASKGPDASYHGSIKLSISGRVPLRAMEAKYQVLRSAIGPSATSLHDASGAGASPERSGERLGARVDVESVIEPKGEAIGAKTAVSYTWWEGERFIGPDESLRVFRTQTVTPYDHWFAEMPTSMYSETRAEDAGEAAAADVIQMLSRVDPRIVGLEVLAARTELKGYTGPAVLYLRDRDAGLLPVDAFGDGMRRILLMALGVTRARGGVLLIDEIETAIHVSALGHVFRWIVEACAANDVQLFATTHSLEALDAILAADTTPAEDIVGYRLESSDKRVTAHRYGEDLLKRLRLARGADVR